MSQVSYKISHHKPFQNPQRVPFIGSCFFIVLFFISSITMYSICGVFSLCIYAILLQRPLFEAKVSFTVLNMNNYDVVLFSYAYASPLLLLNAFYSV